MASSLESSSNNLKHKNVIKIPALKQKPPPIKSPPPHSAPRDSPSSDLSYTGSHTPDNLSTPRQSIGKKRPAEDRDDTFRRPPPRHPATPTRRASLPPMALAHPQTRQLTLSPEPQDHDLVMQDPFAHPATEEQFPEIETEEDLHFYDRLSNIMSLLRNVHAELNSARHENFLNDILQNPEVEHYLEELSSLVPNPVLTGITHIQKLVEDLTQATKTLKIDRPVTENPPDRAIYSSAHACGTSPCEPDRPTHFYSNVVKHTNHIPQMTIKPKPTTRPQQGKPAPANPNAAHHPSRLIAQFLPTGIPENLRPDPNTIVTELNAAIERSHPSRSVKIVTASFNPQGNLIISTRADQTANKILRYRDAVLPVLTNIGNSQHVELREDKKWFKIQIDAVNTSTISIGNERVPLSQSPRKQFAVLPILTNIGNSQHVELRKDKKWFKIQIDTVNTSTISIGNELVPVDWPRLGSERCKQGSNPNPNLMFRSGSAKSSNLNLNGGSGLVSERT